MSHFYPDLASNDVPLNLVDRDYTSLLNAGCQLAVETKPRKTLIHHCTLATPSASAYLSQHLVFSFSFMIMRSDRLNLAHPFPLFSASSSSADCFLMVKCSLLTVPSLPFNLTLKLPSLSGALIPLVSDLQGGRRHRYKTALLLASWRPICPPPLQCTHSPLASGGSVPLLALNRCLAGEQY